MPRAASPAGLGDEAGTGLIGTALGTGVLLLLLLVAAHALVHLYATTVVTGAAFDAARIVSGSDGGPAARADATRHAYDLVGDWASDVEFAFARVDGEEVVLRVRAESPALLPRAFSRVTGIGVIERHVRLRTETFR